MLSSLNNLEKELKEFLQKRGVSIDPIFISDNQLLNFINNNSIKYLLLTKTFSRQVTIAEKIKIILKELSFNRFNETHLKLLNQLDELKYLKDEELLMNLVAKIIEKIINEGYLLPLYQKKFSLYYKNYIKGIELDYYGTPLFQKVRVR